MLSVGVDIDNCVFDTTTLILEMINREHGTEYTLDEMIGYSFESSLGLSQDTVDRIVNAVISQNDAPVMPGAKEVLRWLQLVSFPLYFISDRNIEHYLPTHRQLSGIGLGENIMVLTGQPMGESVPHDKVFFAKEFGLDIFIEDKPAVVSDLFIKTECEIVMFDRPWNREIQTLETLPRVHVVRSWEEIRDFFMAKFREEA